MGFYKLTLLDLCLRYAPFDWTSFETKIAKKQKHQKVNWNKSSFISTKSDMGFNVLWYNFKKKFRLHLKRIIEVYVGTKQSQKFNCKFHRMIYMHNVTGSGSLKSFEFMNYFFFKRVCILLIILYINRFYKAHVCCKNYDVLIYQYINYTNLPKNLQKLANCNLANH